MKLIAINKKIKSLLCAASLALLSVGAQAQTAEDALRYSMDNTTGSARFMALSGAMGAVGGDISTIFYNPAGMGLYKSSEYIIAPRFMYNSATNHYMGMQSKSTSNRMNYGMLGFVSNVPVIDRLNEGPKWKGVQFGFAINRTANYNANYYIEGNSSGGSMVNYWRDQANGNATSNLNAFGSHLAWETYLLDTIAGQINQYSSTTPASGVTQSYALSARGYKNEAAFSVSGNYNDRLFIGGALSFVSLHYWRTVQYSEKALGTALSGEFSSFDMTEQLDTRGNGLNAKLGLIYIINPYVRASAAVHTPTWLFNMKDEYSSRVASKMWNGKTASKASPSGSFDYTLNNPFKAMAGLSFFFQNHGFLSVDYQYTDYSQAELSSGNYAFSQENRNIDESLQAAHQIRIGTEWRLQNVSLRAGYAYSTSPIKKEVNELSNQQFSAGIGFRAAAFFADFAYVRQLNEQDYYMYNRAYVSPSRAESNLNFYSLSLGFKF